MLWLTVMSGQPLVAIDELVLRTALLAIEAMKQLEVSVNEAKVGECYVTGELTVCIDSFVAGRVVPETESGFWQFVVNGDE